jgi:hypothetical protein
METVRTVTVSTRVIACAARRSPVLGWRAPRGTAVRADTSAGPSVYTGSGRSDRP